MAKTSRAMRRAGNPTVTERLDTGAPIGRLQALNADSTRADIREALHNMPEDSRFFQYSEKDGEISAYDDIRKLRDGSFRIVQSTENGTATRTLDEDEMVRRIYKRSAGNSFHTLEPDTSSGVNVNGKKVYKHEGLEFRNGTYDKIVKGRFEGRADRIRKVRESGQITSYQGQRYGVTKKGGEYLTTHVETGLLVGRSKDYAGVVSQIKRASDTISSRPSQYKKTADKFKRTLRGD